MTWNMMCEISELQIIFKSKGTVVLSTSEKIAYMYTFKIMFDTSVIQ